jgi:putative endonuclease
MAYYVYLLASKKHGTLYLGVTNDIVRRGYEHRTKAIGYGTIRRRNNRYCTRKETQEMAA